MNCIARQGWYKSSYSGGSGTECVECAFTGAKALVRDSKQSAGKVVSVAADAWGAFVQAVRHPDQQL